MENRLKQKTKLYSYRQKPDELTRLEPTSIEKLEAKPRRILAGFLGLILFGCSVLMLVVATQLGTQLQEFSFFTGSFSLLFLFVTVIYFDLVIRRRPLYEVDTNGITDHGFLLGGFGFIKWSNIESAQTFVDRNSVSVAVKVNNLDELLERRNILLRPLHWLNAKLSVFLGGEIMLSVTLAKVGHAELLEQISKCSKENGRDVLVPPPSFGKAFVSQGKLSLIVLLIMAIVGVLFFSLYTTFASTSPAQLHILGGLSEHETLVPAGKDSWIDDLIVENYGGASKGIKVELSGSALSSGFLKEPHVLLQCDIDNDSTPLHATTRTLLTMRQERKNVWVGTSATAVFPNKDRDFVDAYKLFAPWERSALKESIGWWSDTISPSVKVQLFANVASKGNGDLNIKVTPMASPNGAVNQSLKLKPTQGNMHNAPLYAVHPPKEYPVTLYPGGQISWLSPVELKFDSAAKPEEIDAYYKKELQNRGWKVSYKHDGGLRQRELTATKKGHDITIRIERISGHTPVWMSIH